MSSSYQIDFYNQFVDLYALYKEVRQLVILAEYENENQKFIITSVNELRNAFDHVMRIMEDSNSMQTNFNKAKAHLYRASYDALEIISLSKLQRIKSIREQFQYNDIVEAYPQYHTQIIPIVERTKQELSIARANKDLNDLGSEKNCFEKFEKIVQDLSLCVDDINLHIQGIVEAKQNHSQKYSWKKKEFWFGALVSLCIGIIVTLLSYKLR